MLSVQEEAITEQFMMTVIQAYNGLTPYRCGSKYSNIHSMKFCARFSQKTGKKPSKLLR
jgi:hypothetical protein